MLALAFAAFLIFGVLLVLVGATQAELAAELGLDLAASGGLAAALSLGLGVGVAASGPFVDRLPRRPIFVGAALVGAGSLAAAGPGAGYLALLAILAGVGVGCGTFETLLNTAVAERGGDRSAARLSLIHAAATAGAVAGPALIHGLGAWTTSFRVLAFALLLLAAVGAVVRFPAPRPRALAPGTSGRLWPDILPYAVIAASYVGVETTLTLFAVPLATTGLGLSEVRGLRAISTFWLGLLLGRLLFMAYRGRATPRLLGAPGVAAAVLLLAGVGAGAPGPELLLGGAGLALGLVFPLMVALVASRFAHATGTATGLVVGAGALGGFAIPWLTGTLGDALGPRFAVASLAGWCLLMAGAAWLARAAAPVAGIRNGVEEGAVPATLSPPRERGAS